MSITSRFPFFFPFDFHVSITSPLTYLGPGKRTLVRGEGGENDFTQIQFLASISNFLSLTKWKFQQRSPEGWSGWVKYAPTPPLTARQMLMVGLLWWLRILDPARVTPLTINQWITVGPIVSGEDSVIWIQPALFSTYCWWSLLDPLCCVI